MTATRLAKTLAVGLLLVGLDLFLKDFGQTHFVDFGFLSIGAWANERWLFIVQLPFLFGVVLSTVILLAVILQTIWQYKNEFSTYWAWLLISLGGLLNIGERILIGQVRDPLQFYSGLWNLSDFYILVGLLWIALTFKQQK